MASKYDEIKTTADLITEVRFHRSTHSELVFNNGLHEFETAIFRHSGRGGEGIIKKL